MMHILSIVRDERRDTGIEGRLFVDGLIVGPTLERLAVAIPAGVWPVRLHHSPKFGRPTIWIDAGRGYSLIHSGGIPEHSRSCVLLGRDDLDGARISGGAPLVSWLEAHVLGADRASRAAGVLPDWLAVVHEIGGDVADGVTA